MLWTLPAPRDDGQVTPLTHSLPCSPTSSRGHADLVVWDPSITRTISAATQHQRIDYNLYEGMEITGAPSVVLARGRVLVQDGEWHGERGAGRFVARERFVGM